MAAMSQELARHREQRSGLKSRQNVLADLQTKREGVSQVVRELLKNRDAGKGFTYVKGIVADALSTDLENATVIEAALGELQNAVVVSDSAALLADREHWQKLAGRVTVLAADKMLAYQDGYDWSRHGKNAVAAIDLVKTEGETSLLMHQLLGRTVIVETLADALELADAGPREYRFVTRSGEVVEAGSANHALTLGDMSKRGGIITRRAEVAKLEQELAQKSKRKSKTSPPQISQCDQTSRELFDARQQELRQPHLPGRFPARRE